MAAAAAAFPGCCGLRRLQSPRAWLQTIRCSGTFPCPSPEFPPLPPPGTGMAVEEASSDSRSDAGSRAAEVATAASVCSTKASVRSPSLFPKRGQTLELVCESLAFKGNGVCKMADTGFVVMCDRALPGERFIGRVSRKKGNYAEENDETISQSTLEPQEGCQVSAAAGRAIEAPRNAVKKLETLSPHWDIVDAPCKYASDCGGCKTQNLLYEAQVRSKEQQVHELLTHVGKFSNKDPEFATFLRPIIPCNVRYHYRNKMEFSFGTKKWLPTDQLSSAKVQDVDTYALGLHAPGYFDRVLHIENCLLQSEAANKVLAAVQDNWIDPTSGLSPYNVHTHTGFLKHLMLRTGRDCTTGLPELMVNFVTASYNPELLIPLVNKIVDIPEVVSIVNNVNTSVGNTSVGEEEYILYGKPTITETLRGLTFQISANSFFQTNTHQAEVLYKLIEDCAGLRGDGSEIVLDLFCGTGTIGLTLAKRARHVYGYEVVAQAISDACRNAELNDIENATFVQGDLNKINDDFGNDFPKPDVVIADPNRPGMHMKLIEFLIRLKASRIVYVSCNPSTCSRDLDYLCHGVEEKNIKGCYKLRSLQPVDMFPHTPHIECVCLLELCC